LTDLEVEQAQTQGYTGLRLGPRILRTETAPLAALTLLQHIWGDF
ncbi:MAG TPA: 16S rRNA (uracil(1498)-N(3))-methyltransferase, partial [Oceanospirillaceae bacterium]|nr:16S rRNA (uracil(1498)-N(3))-methyltransferase [Oceanospirillaceae bacterium]